MLSVRVSGSVTVVSAPNDEGATVELSISEFELCGELLQEVAKNPITKIEKRNFIKKDLIKKLLLYHVTQ